MKKILGLFFGILIGVTFISAGVLGKDHKFVVQARNNETAVKSIDYALAYPGILPDSPLYFIKVIRDRVVSFLIQSPVKKSFYLLLLSDKRLAAGQVLINTGKSNVGVTTVVNGEEYFTEAVTTATEAKKQGKDVNELVAKLSVAGVKHDEVISELAKKVSGIEANQMSRAYDSNQKSREKTSEIMKK